MLLDPFSPAALITHWPHVEGPPENARDGLDGHFSTTGVMTVSWGTRAELEQKKMVNWLPVGIVIKRYLSQKFEKCKFWLLALMV